MAASKKFKDAASDFLEAGASPEIRRKIWRSKVWISPSAAHRVEHPFCRAVAMASTLNPGVANELIAAAIAGGIDLNEPIRRRESMHQACATIFHDALERGTADFVAHLLSCGADPTILYRQTRYESTPDWHNTTGEIDAAGLLEHFHPKDGSSKRDILTSWHSRRAIEEALSASRAPSKGDRP